MACFWDRIARRTEALIESALFNHRPLWLGVFTLITLFLAYHALQLKPDASFARMVPTHHPYISASEQYASTLKSSGNTLRIALTAQQGDIFTAEYMDLLRKVNDEVFYLQGVDRAGMQSLWTPNVRWSEVTEEGFEGDAVIPKDYDGSSAALQTLKGNILKSGQVGRLVANDFRSSIIVVPLLEFNPATGERLDYQAFAHQLEARVRDQYQTEQFNIHIVGQAKILGDFLDGILSIGLFGLAALVIIFGLLYWYSRCLRSTLIPILCSIIAMVWQLGLLGVSGNGLDAYSVLVPFLVFSIAISHSVQIINTIAHESAHGASRLMAARIAFRGLYIAGMTALLSDAVGFLTLLIIDIEVIRSLAIAASLGVLVVIVTNLALLPILMSYIGVGSKTARYALAEEKGQLKQELKIWHVTAALTSPRHGIWPVAIAAVLFVLGLIYSQDLKIGDLDKGAPELQVDSRYNLDNSFIVDHYSTSSDQMIIMVESPAEQCSSHRVMDAVDDLQWRLNNTPGVQSTFSLANISKQVNVGMNEGNWKWYEISRNRSVLNNSVSRNIPEGMLNRDCSMLTITTYLNDHRAETLNAVIQTVQAFEEAQPVEEVHFRLASGNAGIAAATNQEIEIAQQRMLVLVYTVVGALVLLTFRSLAAVTCVLLPLALTSVLCQALMTYLNIGVKVATLPVIALGVGIGVDYGIYIYSRFSNALSSGMDIRDAYIHTLQITGRAVGFTGITLAAGVLTWLLSPIKFQADMGILLGFMFILNMIGAIILIPAFAGLLLRRKAEVPVLQPQT